MKKTAMVEGLKEALRVVVLAVLPVLISSINTTSGVINVDRKIVLAVGVLTILRMIDKYLHELEKNKPFSERNDGLLGVKGLTGF